MIPKRGVNVMGHETARLLKLTNNQGVMPLQFIVPRKSDAIQDDVFPECLAPTPAHTGEQFFAGSSQGSCYHVTQSSSDWWKDCQEEDVRDCYTTLERTG